MPARIGDTDDKPADAGRDDEVGAGRAMGLAAARGAGFERDVKRRAACPLARVGKGYRLGMRAATFLRPTPSDDFAVLDDDRADPGIGAADRAGAAGEAGGGGEPAGVVAPAAVHRGASFCAA